MRIVLAVFDKNNDQRIELAEFKDALKKYVDWKPAVTKDLESETINKETAKRVTTMLNEQKREKKVFETTVTDHEDPNEVKSREAQALALIKSGKMPIEIMDGEI